MRAQRAPGPRAREAATVDVLCIDADDYHVGLAATDVEVVRDAAEAASGVPGVSLAALLERPDDGADARAIRVRTPDGAVDLLTRQRLAVRAVARGAIAPLPPWLAGLAARAALGALTPPTDGEPPLLLLDPARLAAHAGGPRDGR